MCYTSTTTIFRHDRNIEKDCSANLFVFRERQWWKVGVPFNTNYLMFQLFNWKYEINSAIGVNWRCFNVSHRQYWDIITFSLLDWCKNDDKDVKLSWWKFISVVYNFLVLNVCDLMQLIPYIPYISGNGIVDRSSIFGFSF